MAYSLTSLNYEKYGNKRHRFHLFFFGQTSDVLWQVVGYFQLLSHS